MKNQTKSLPSFKELIELELLAKSRGSGINYDQLLGKWEFQVVWPKGKEQADIVLGSFLRFVSATLILKKDPDRNEIGSYQIINSIRIGTLLIELIGTANLFGKQPLLMFLFDKVEISVLKKIFFKQLLDFKVGSKKPFYALIAIEQNGTWLAARGKGGGIATWRINSEK